MIMMPSGGAASYSLLCFAILFLFLELAVVGSCEAR